MADRGLELALRVSADTTQGRAAIAALNKSIASAGKGSGGALDPFTASVARATGGAQELTTRLGPLSSALAGVAAALSVKQVSKRWSGFGEIVRKAPYLSGAVILVIGVYIGVNGWLHLSGGL